MTDSVLVVDDDPFTRRLITTTLEDVGFELYEAADGDEAVQLAQSTQPRLVFLDVDMPGLDGIAACQQLRSSPAGDEATIVMLAGDCRDGLERRAEEAGADIFLTKPFSPLQLLRILGGLNRRAGRPRAWSA